VALAASPDDQRRGVVTGESWMMVPQGREPVLRRPAAGTGRIDGHDRQVSVRGHLRQAVPEPGGGDASDQPPEPPAGLASREPVPCLLASLAAGFGEVEVFGDDGPRAAFPGGGECLTLFPVGREEKPRGVPPLPPPGLGQPGVFQAEAGAHQPPAAPRHRHGPGSGPPLDAGQTALQRLQPDRLAMPLGGGRVPGKAPGPGAGGDGEPGLDLPDAGGEGTASGIDYLAFSGHKVYAPFGAGVLVGRGDWLDAAPPYLAGGGAVRQVRLGATDWAASPARHEGGTPNVIGAVALAAACRFIDSLPAGAVEAHEGFLTDRLVSEHAVGVRHGRFCAHPLLARLAPAGAVPDGEAVRASLGLGSRAADVDRLVGALGALRAHGPSWAYAGAESGFSPRPDPRALPDWLAGGPVGQPSPCAG
jgi:hypothetical protein